MVSFPGGYCYGFPPRSNIALNVPFSNINFNVEHEELGSLLFLSGKFCRKMIFLSQIFAENQHLVKFLIQQGVLLQKRCYIGLLTCAAISKHSILESTI